MPEELRLNDEVHHQAQSGDRESDKKQDGGNGVRFPVGRDGQSQAAEKVAEEGVPAGGWICVRAARVKRHRDQRQEHEL
jgi:hypothetical protein